MASSLCKASVLKIYQDVIEDVISGVREVFMEEGVDEQVLQELRQVWETKLMATKAVQSEAEEKAKKQEQIQSNGFPKQPALPHNQLQQSQPVQANAGPLQPVVETKMVPIQITLPPQPNTDGAQRVLTIQVPATALQGNQLQKVLTGPVITATMNLPPAIASSLLQQHVNAAFNSQQQALTVINKNVVQTDGAVEEEEEEVEIEFVLPRSKTKKVRSKASTSKAPQVDGSMDTSDEGSEASEDDPDDDDLDDDKDDEEEMEEEGGEEEPLNSEDDVSDDDPGDLFDTDNIVVCQYDKIIRNRNKWKFYLKDGIMNLNGLDYVFQKANGEAEW